MSLFEKNEPATDIADIEAYFLSYDIPQNANLEPEDKNPAGFLRNFAFHTQKSVWVVQRGDIPHGLIGRLLDAGATVDLIKFDAGETDRLLEMASRCIEHEITMKRRNAAASYADAVQELHDDTVSADSALSRFRSKNNAIIRRLTTHLDALTRCATRWCVAKRIPCLTSSINGIHSLRRTMLVRATAYKNAIEEIRKRNGWGDFMANALERDQIPAGIAADYMDELGLDGQSLRSAFFE